MSHDDETRTTEQGVRVHRTTSQDGKLEHTTETRALAGGEDLVRTSDLVRTGLEAAVRVTSTGAPGERIHLGARDADQMVQLELDADAARALIQALTQHLQDIDPTL